ncbi:BgTH12-05909 [Blumeria graminis f. sp. triticale]|nr:BgTH12-05909 [Blumeria graminis f. sp. triticale]
MWKFKTFLFNSASTSPAYYKFESFKVHFQILVQARYPRNFSISKITRETKANMTPQIQKFELKTPKGTKDWQGKDMIIRDNIFSKISDVFKRHGGVTIDTPVFELKEILSGKYGEDSKLIYDLEDQGGEICSLRYDLTVPFARWLAMNRDVQNIKRYHIAKVYRRDQPAISKGRMREFYQCDFDIAGSYDSMLPDAEIVRIATEVFHSLGWKGNFTIKINHRKILDGIFEACGVPADKIRATSSAIDKLDKLPWEEVRKEMTEQKGLPIEVANKIGEYVVQKGQKDLLLKLKSDEFLHTNLSMSAGIADMELLFDYLEAFNALESVSFDLSLARGLDYYTGIIFEVVTEGSAPTAGLASSTNAKKSSTRKKSSAEPDDRSSDPSIGVGSIAAGGRYDNLVGMFSGKTQIPCVGISFGVDRIFSIMKARMAANNVGTIRNNQVDCFVMAFGGKGFTGLVKERISICATLWEAGIKAEFLYKVKPKLPNQFKAAEVNGVPFCIVIGEEELSNGQVKIKEMGLQDGHPEKEGILINLEDIVPELSQRLKQKDSENCVAQKSEIVHGVGIKSESLKSSQPDSSHPTLTSDTATESKINTNSIAENQS